MSISKLFADYLENTGVYAMLKNPRWSRCKRLRNDLLKFHKSKDRMPNKAESYAIMDNLILNPDEGNAQRSKP